MEQKLGILSRTAVGQECMLVVFVEQPQPRGMRFRYPCEGHSAGSLFGENSTEANRTYPTLQLLKYTVPVPVELMICLVTADQPYKPHPHNLVGKNCRDGIYRVELPPGTREHMFSSVGIQCCKKNDVRNIILKRLSDGIDPFDVKDQALQTESINLNSVRLCVQPVLLYSYGRQVMPPTVSDIIYDKKNTCASILKIIRFNKIAGSVLGDDEVILLCDKVQKDNIKVRFFLDNWEAWGIFSANDVHRQIAITFKTPPYKDPCISSPVEVYLQLFRPSDRVTSEAKPYSFIPQCKDPHGLIRKRWMNNTAHCFPQDASLSLPFLPPNETPCSSIEHARGNVAIRRRIGSYSHSSNVLVGRGLQPASVIPMAVLAEAPVMEMGACSMSSGELGSLIQQQATEEEQEKLFQLINQELLVSSGMLEPSISPLFSETIAEVYPAPYDDPPVVTTPNNFNLASAGGLISSDVMLSQVREQDSLTEEGVLFAPLTHLTEEL